MRRPSEVVMGVTAPDNTLSVSVRETYDRLTANLLPARFHAEGATAPQRMAVITVRELCSPAPRRVYRLPSALATRSILTPLVPVERTGDFALAGTRIAKNG